MKIKIELTINDCVKEEVIEIPDWELEGIDNFSRSMKIEKFVLQEVAKQVNLKWDFVEDE